MAEHESVIAEEFFKTLRTYSGFYECPCSVDGKRAGPLVGYAGRDDKGRQFVGEVYANCAVLEKFPRSGLKHFAFHLAEKAEQAGLKFDLVFGLPLGGLSLGLMIADILGKEYGFPEKKVTRAATETEREQSILVLGRHEIHPGTRVLLAEDVGNNFSTTLEAIELVERNGGIVAGQVCLLNRSLNVEDVFSHHDQDWPVVSLVRKPISQWRQDDPNVAEDVARNNVVWKPKAEWFRLEMAMRCQ